MLVGFKNGKKEWSNELKLPVGVPAVAKKLVIVPWARNRISLLNAESGDEQIWYVYLRDNQLPNSGFEDWHQTVGLNNQPMYQPGSDEETTLWTTANMGSSTYGIYGTITGTRT